MSANKKGSKKRTIIPAGTTLCPRCDGSGCTMCAGNGYIDTHKDRQNPKIPPRPVYAHGCGATDWWWREPRMIYGRFYSPGEWVCRRCHPPPE